MSQRPGRRPLLRSGVPIRPRIRRLPAVAIWAAAALAGCGIVGWALAPQPCEQRYSEIRCLAMTDEAASQLGVTREEIAALSILPDPTPRVVDGKKILEIRSGGPPIIVEVWLKDGSTHQVTMPCGGIPSNPVCFDPPRLQVSSPTQNGYRDRPEGATELPTPAPDALAAASALRIERFEIPIDHTGTFEVRLGRASLPNGILTSAEFELVDAWPPGVTILSGRVDLMVRSIVDGQPLWNYYIHGWREGVEPVEAVLVFDVFRFDPGAVLAIRNVVVE